jgi:hypothetical protein
MQLIFNQQWDNPQTTYSQNSYTPFSEGSIGQKDAKTVNSIKNSMNQSIQSQLHTGEQEGAEEKI